MPSKDNKTNFALLREKILQKSGKDYWRSVEEFSDAPEFDEFVKNEYPQHAEDWEDGLSRRNFIKVMGASLAFAGLTGCVIQPAEKIIPYVRQPEELIPGKPLFYATAMTLGGTATGLLAKSNEGRPTKIEGNPDHPQSLGATDVLAQASLLNLYDPDRSQEVVYRGTPSTWQRFMTELRAKLDENRVDGGAGVRFLTETVTSPTLIAQMRQVLAELPNARWYQYEPINKDNSIAGAKLAFGSPAQPVYKFDQATRVLSLDADIFSNFNVRYIKDFNKSRLYNEEKKEINRLYAVETTMTLTGAKADHRLAVKPSQMPEIAKAIAAAVGVSGASSTYTENAQWIQTMAKDLQANRGKSIVIAGDNQPPVVHALAHAINQTLGNVGTTVTYIEPFQPFADVLQVDQLRQLITEIDNGAVKMLVLMGGNPVYNTPADLKLNAERMRNKIPFTVHLGHYSDETAELCYWHISEKHYLESWSDTRAFDGTVTIVQPLIQPLYESHSIHELAQLFFKENYDKKDYDIVKENWQKQGFSAAPKAMTTTAGNQTLSQNGNPTGGDVNPSPKNFDDNWRKVVHNGMIPNTAAMAKSVTVNGSFMSQPTAPVQAGNLEISILPDPSVYDGRFTNNGWLQELPNPLTKITWENVALISPKTAESLQINRKVDDEEFVGGSQGTTFINTKGGNLLSDAVRLKMNGAEIKQDVPMWITPGQPDNVITIYMGYGRTRAGRIGSDIGYNAFDAQTSSAMWNGFGEISKTGEQKTIASSQIHFNMEGRDILRTWEINEVEARGELSKEKQEEEAGYDASMYPGFQYTGNKWGMTIDLNSCVGCNACVIACQSENNIPVVGREQVERSREMHWMRVDAYYSGDDIANPDGHTFSTASLSAVRASSVRNRLSGSRDGS